jgi:hypothetical protein
VKSVRKKAGKRKEEREIGGKRGREGQGGGGRSLLSLVVTSEIRTE